jgi:5-formyltetrahydrofolate cyclo-ligase
MIDKKELRKKMKAVLKAVTPEQYLAEGEAAAEKLCESADWKAHKRTLLYVSMAGEFETTPLLRRAFAEGKEVYVPRTEGGSKMRFYRIAGPDGPWSIGAYDIREPLDCTEKTLFRPEDGPALIITPALAFDRAGNRMGRGAGFYDRFFATLPKTGFFLCGLSLTVQVIDGVPMDKFDRPVNALCTAKEYLRFR